jgi:hypothetical protein
MVIPLGMFKGGSSKGFFKPVKNRFISSPPSFYDIDTHKLVKILGCYDEFVDFSSYKQRGGNLG